MLYRLSTIDPDRLLLALRFPDTLGIPVTLGRYTCRLKRFLQIGLCAGRLGFLSLSNRGNINDRLGSFTWNLCITRAEQQE